MYDVDHENRTRLPAAVYDLAIRLGAKPTDTSSTIRLNQTGRMRKDLASDTGMPFTATQPISTSSCAFNGRAKIGPWYLVSVRDALVDGEGRLNVTAMRVIPVARAANTPTLVRGELMRYLAEIAWVPQAILCNHALRWRAEDSSTISVSAGSDKTISEVLLSLDVNDRIDSGFAQARPRSVAMSMVPTPWRGQFSDYRLVDECGVPFAGEVARKIDGKAMSYWQGKQPAGRCTPTLRRLPCVPAR